MSRLQDGVRAQAGKQEQFRAAVGDAGRTRRCRRGLHALAAEAGVRANTLAVQAHRMRQRLRQLVRLELLQTVGSREALEQELAELRGVLHRPHDRSDATTELPRLGDTAAGG